MKNNFSHLSLYKINSSRFGELAKNWKSCDITELKSVCCTQHNLCKNFMCLWTKVILFVTTSYKRYASLTHRCKNVITQYFYFCSKAFSVLLWNFDHHPTWYVLLMLWRQNNVWFLTHIEYIIIFLYFLVKALLSVIQFHH